MMIRCSLSACMKLTHLIYRRGEAVCVRFYDSLMCVALWPDVLAPGSMQHIILGGATIAPARISVAAHPLNVTLCDLAVGPVEASAAGS